MCKIRIIEIPLAEKCYMRNSRFPFLYPTGYKQMMYY